MRKTMCALMAIAWAGTAAAQTPAFDPREWKGTAWKAAPSKAVGEEQAMEARLKTPAAPSPPISL